MALTDQQYYSSSSNYGTYQYLSLYDIVNNFILMYTGDDNLVTHTTNRSVIVFHAKRGIQEFNYDAANEAKTVELQVTDNLRAILPSDYINYVKLYLNINGVLFELFESTKPLTTTTYAQDSGGDIIFDNNGEAITVSSLIGTATLSTYEYLFSPYGYFGWCIGDSWYYPFNYFGMDTSKANVNPTFTIDKKNGIINFSSNMSGGTLELEYISDGLSNNEDEIMINKLAETFIYAYIKSEILSNKASTPEYIVTRAKREKFASYNNAKLRMSGMHPSRLLMILRGQSKWIK